MKISFNSLKSRCASLGFQLGRSDAGVYSVTAHGEYGPAYDGDFESIRHWVLGLEYERQHTLHNYVLLKKEN